MKIAVIAGNHREFERFIRSRSEIAYNYVLEKEMEFTKTKFRLGDTTYFYVVNTDTLLGVRFDDFIAIGTYLDRQDLQDIKYLIISNILARTPKIPEWVEQI